ncbi:MAG: LysE family translocator [Cohnella sp.]|nr:LysE family translocator [Cohnella sp.]
MDTGTWLAFLGASVLLTLMPGPDILFVVAQSVAGSRKDGSAIALGLCSGLLVHITAAALGISAVVYGLPYALPVVKTAGAFYLFYLAWLSFKPPTLPAVVDDSESPQLHVTTSFGRLYRRGILMNVLNPKVSLFFIAFLPSFVKDGAGPVPLQMFLLGGLFLLQALVIFHLVALFADRLGRRFLHGGSNGSRWSGTLQGLLYSALAILLLLD